MSDDLVRISTANIQQRANSNFHQRQLDILKSQGLGGPPLSSELLGFTTRAGKMLFSPDGRFVIIGDGHIQIAYHMDTLEPAFKVVAQALAVDFTNGDLLLAREDGIYRSSWTDSATPWLMYWQIGIDSERATTISLSPCGKYIAFEDMLFNISTLECIVSASSLISRFSDKEISSTIRWKAIATRYGAIFYTEPTAGISYLTVFDMRQKDVLSLKKIKDVSYYPEKDAIAFIAPGEESAQNELFIEHLETRSRAKIAEVRTLNKCDWCDNGRFVVTRNIVGWNVYDSTSGKVLAEYRLEDPSERLFLVKPLPNSPHVLITYFHGLIALRSVISGDLILEMPSGGLPARSVKNIEFLTENLIAAQGSLQSKAGSIYIYDRQVNTPWKRFSGYWLKRCDNAPRISTDASTIALVRSSSPQIWSLESDDPVPSFFSHPNEKTSDEIQSKNLPRFVAGFNCPDDPTDYLVIFYSRKSGIKELVLYKAIEGKKISSLHLGEDFSGIPQVSNTATFHLRGNHLFLVSTNYSDQDSKRFATGSVTIWDWRTGRLVHSLNDLPRGSWPIADISSDGQLISLATDGAPPQNGEHHSFTGIPYERHYVIWNIWLGKEIFRTPTFETTNLAKNNDLMYSLFSPDNRTLIVCHDGFISVYDVLTQAHLFTLNKFVHVHMPISISPEGRYLAVGSGTVDGEGAVSIFGDSTRYWFAPFTGYREKVRDAVNKGLLTRLQAELALKELALPRQSTLLEAWLQEEVSDDFFKARYSPFEPTDFADNPEPRCPVPE